MAKIRIAFLPALLLVLLSSVGVEAKKRELLYSKSASGKLPEIIATIRNGKSTITPSAQLTRKTEYFVRIAPRKYIFTPEGKLQDGARLGGTPFVFMSTPESVYGLSLLDIYVGIGYEAEDIIRWQRDEDMVMMIFKYPSEIAASEITNGRLPADWDKKVLIPTWPNVLSLFQLLATPRPVTQPLAPERTLVLTDAEREFVLGFSADRKQRITKIAYAVIKAEGGPDWQYRSLLEQKLSVFEHFRGNGETQNEVSDPDGVKAGLLEFVGPNWSLKELPELAIVHLGKLTMKDSYDGGCTLCRSGK
jgi:hypothetical protein